MSAMPQPRPNDRDALKRAAAEAAVKLVQNDMVVGLGSGSTAAFAIEALARLRRDGLRFVGIPTSQRTADLARTAGIALTSFGEHRQIDLTIDGADEVERGTLNLIKGRGGALLHEKIVAAATRQLAIIVDATKLVDPLRTHVPVPVEVVAFGLEATQAALEVLGASARLRLSTPAQPFITDSGNRIIDCKFDRITDPARLEERIRRIVGVIDSGLFISRADPVFVADASGVRRLDSARSHRGTPPILVIMGVSGSGKTTVAKELAARLGWAFEEGNRPSSGNQHRQDACRHSARPRQKTACHGSSASRPGSTRSAPKSSRASSPAPRSSAPIVKSSSATGPRSGSFICAAARTSSPIIWPAATATSCRRACCSVRSTRSKADSR